MKSIFEKLPKTFIQFIKFGIVGVINTFTSYVIVNTAHYVFNIHIQISNIIAFLISVLGSFVLNSVFVFKNKNETLKNKLKSLLKSYASYSFTGLILTAILIEIECEKLGIPLYIASLLNLVITVPINFLLNKFWTFNAKNKKEVDYNKLAKDHTFVICAYKESEYLEDCIKSVINQSIKSNYIIATSTPCEYIESLAKKYNIKYEIKNTKSDIQDDWNFAANCANTNLVTVAHQDDIYEKDYLKYILQNYDENSVMYFTDYFVYKNNKKTSDINSKIKKVLKLFIRSKILSSIKFFKVLSLSFGNSINCPSVTYNKKLIDGNIFTSDLKFALDWDTFLKFAKTKSRFNYIAKKLICYRVHDGATTKEFIVDNRRENEDIIMFSKIWPKFITKIIMKFYKLAYSTYN